MTKTQWQLMILQLLKNRGLIKTSGPCVFQLTEKGKKAVAAFMKRPDLPKPWC